MTNLQSLRTAFAGRLLTGRVDMAPFLTDWRGKWRGDAIAVAQPDDAAGVGAVVRWCHEHGVPVVPQGGNSGLSGGATPDATGRALVLSLTRLHRVRNVDPVNNTIEVEAGATLLNVQEAAQAADRLFPLSLAAEGSCTIGGNLATNAGGVQVLRYGNARELCLGLEVVTADGQVWSGLRRLRKDNTGYDLRDLFIGSEGTLGVITAAVLKLFPQPKEQVVAFVAVPSPGAAVSLLQVAQERLSYSLTAFELMSDACIALVERHVPTARLPLSQRSPWYVLVEVSETQQGGRGSAGLEALLEDAFDQGHATDAALSTSLAQFHALWALREDISEAQGANGPTIKHDISLPISHIADFIAAMDATLARAFPETRLIVFGHVGDGNLHYNLSPAAGAQSAADRERFRSLEGQINHVVHDAVIAHDGSISAEHGLGVLRRDESARFKSPIEMQLMRAVKNALDPRGLMNPGKLITPSRSTEPSPPTEFPS
ncbi:MAG: FAD-binding oxidoreductase [Betaproteobacteria bacterium]